MLTTFITVTTNTTDNMKPEPHHLTPSLNHNSSVRMRLLLNFFQLVHRKRFSKTVCNVISRVDESNIKLLSSHVFSDKIKNQF